jgi:hypothetical protein
LIQTSALSGPGPDGYSIGTTFTSTAYSKGVFVKFTDADWKKAGAIPTDAQMIDLACAVRSSCFTSSSNAISWAG